MHTTRAIGREIGTALAVLAIYLLTMLAPMHQARASQLAFEDLGYTTLVTSWVLCTPQGAAGDDTDVSVAKCPATGIGKQNFILPALAVLPAGLDVTALAQPIRPLAQRRFAHAHGAARRSPRAADLGLIICPFEGIQDPVQFTGSPPMIRFTRAAVAAVLLLVTPAFANDGDIQLGALTISKPFTRATLPNAPVGGGFFTIENTGTEADRLVSVTSTLARDTQIHEMAMDGDVMKMRELPDGLDIPAGETVVLAPGGFHLMFMGLSQPFVEGETVSVTLTFEKAGSVDLALPVQSSAADAPAAMGHGHQ